MIIGSKDKRIPIIIFSEVVSVSSVFSMLFSSEDEDRAKSDSS